MKRTIIDYIDSTIDELTSRKNYTRKQAEKVVERINKLISVELVNEEEKEYISSRIDNLLANAKIEDSRLISKVSPRNITISKKAAITLASFGTVGALAIGGAVITGCGEKEPQAMEQEVDIDSIKAEVKAELVKEMEAEKTDAVQEETESKEEKTKVLSDSLSFDPNDNNELVERMTNFIAQSWKNGIDVPVDKMMDYYMVMNLEDIDPVDYARLSYSNKTAEDILNNYQYCANIYMDDLLTINKDTQVDYSIIVADKDSAQSLNTLQSKIAEMNSEIISSKDVHDYIYDTYITGKGQREFLFNVGPNFQAYNFMFSFDELTNGLGLSQDENDILNEDRKVLCSSDVVVGEKNKSDKAQEQTSIINQLKEKLSASLTFYNQDLTNISESEQKTGIELENEITANLKKLGAVLVENPEFKGSYAYSENGSYSSKSNGSLSGKGAAGGSAGGENTSVQTNTTKVPYTSTSTKNYANGATSEAEAIQSATKAAQKAAEEAAKIKAKEEDEKETTVFVPVTPTVVDTDEKIIDKPYVDTPTPSTPSTPSTPETPSTPSTPETPSTPSTPSTPEVTTDDPTSIIIDEEIETYDYTEISNDGVANDNLNELYQLRDELLGLQTYSESQEYVKTR